MEMESKVQMIEEELKQNRQNYIDPNNSLNNGEFSKGEFKIALNSLKTKKLII